LTCHELFTAVTTAACITLPPSAIGCERLWGRCMILDARQSDTQAEVDDHGVILGNRFLAMLQKPLSVAPIF